LDFNDDAGRAIYKNPLTDEDIKSYVQDLRVLGKKDFKALIKWREQIRISMGIEKTKEEKAKEVAEREDMKQQELAAKAEGEESVADEVIYGLHFKPI
jgi:AdoMet-dependent rRNA methyltransferase SPB1